MPPRDPARAGAQHRASQRTGRHAARRQHCPRRGDPLEADRNAARIQGDAPAAPARIEREREAIDPAARQRAREGGECPQRAAAFPERENHVRQREARAFGGIRLEKADAVDLRIALFLGQPDQRLGHSAAAKRERAVDPRHPAAAVTAHAAPAIERETGAICRGDFKARQAVLHSGRRDGEDEVGARIERGGRRGGGSGHLRDERSDWRALRRRGSAPDLVEPHPREARRARGDLPAIFEATAALGIVAAELQPSSRSFGQAEATRAESDLAVRSRNAAGEGDVPRHIGNPPLWHGERGEVHARRAVPAIQSLAQYRLERDLRPLGADGAAIEARRCQRAGQIGPFPADVQLHRARQAEHCAAGEIEPRRGNARSARKAIVEHPLARETEIDEAVAAVEPHRDIGDIELDVRQRERFSGRGRHQPVDRSQRQAPLHQTRLDPDPTGTQRQHPGAPGRQRSAQFDPVGHQIWIAGIADHDIGEPLAPGRELVDLILRTDAPTAQFLIDEFACDGPPLQPRDEQGGQQQHEQCEEQARPSGAARARSHSYVIRRFIQACRHAVATPARSLWLRSHLVSIAGGLCRGARAARTGHASVRKHRRDSPHGMGAFRALSGQNDLLWTRSHRRVTCGCSDMK